MTFKAYLDNIQAKSGKSPEDFWKLANKKGFVKHGRVVASHAELLKWLKAGIGLGHVYANIIILYLRLRTGDPRVSAKMKKWANLTWHRR